MTTTTIPAHRGTSNTNDRGSAASRRARRAWMMVKFADDCGDVRCYRCNLILVNTGSWRADNYMTVDRILPGIEGGRYVRSNIRPACGHCNSETGQALAQARIVLSTNLAV